MYNTTEEMLEGTILLDVQDNIVSTEMVVTNCYLRRRS